VKLSIIVPCYNEEETVGEVLKRVLALQLPCEVEVMVVDDGSTDNSMEIVAKFPHVHLIRHEINKGKGAAIRTGIERSSGDVFLIQDADLEYFPEDIPQLLQPILADKADVVLGSRFLGEPIGMSRSHLLANKTLSYATRALFGSRTTDLMTGYKVFTRKALRKFSVNSTSFDVEAELVGKFLNWRLRVTEIPIHYEYRKKGRAKITWRHGFTSLWTLFKIKFCGFWQTAL
jgi:glycosyltransferase involved in cell wall biosynthesis